MRRLAVPAALALLLVSSAPAPAAQGTDDARQALMAADTAFALTVAQRSLAAFSNMISEKALFLGSTPHHGRPEIIHAWKGFFEPDRKTTLSWTPVRADVAASGDLGYTVGTFVLRTIDDAGAVTEKHGAYVTIWRKESDGRWRAVIDTGTPPGSTPVEIPRD